jgi:hypothetical protein
MGKRPMQAQKEIIAAAARERQEGNHAGTLTVEANEMVALDEREKIGLGPRGDNGRAPNQDRRREASAVGHAMKRPLRTRNDTNRNARKKRHEGSVDCEKGETAPFPNLDQKVRADPNRR